MMDLLLILLLVVVAHWVSRNSSARGRLGIGIAIFVVGALVSDVEGGVFILAVPLVMLVDHAFHEWRGGKQETTLR